MDLYTPLEQSTQEAFLKAQYNDDGFNSWERQNDFFKDVKDLKASIYNLSNYSNIESMITTKDYKKREIALDVAKANNSRFYKDFTYEGTDSYYSLNEAQMDKLYKTGVGEYYRSMLYIRKTIYNIKEMDSKSGENAYYYRYKENGAVLKEVDKTVVENFGGNLPPLYVKTYIVESLPNPPATKLNYGKTIKDFVLQCPNVLKVEIVTTKGKETYKF